MTGITDELKKVWKHEQPNETFLVSLLRWCSAYEKNILECQVINKQFATVNKQVLSRKLALNNKLTHFIGFPSGYKENEKTKFFYLDLAKYYGWTTTELFKNIKNIDIEKMKQIIASSFGYDTKQRKAIGLKKRKLK